MDFLKNNVPLLLVLAIIVILAALHPDKTKELIGSVISTVSSSSTPSPAPEAASSPAEAASQPAASPASVSMTQAELAVESYMRKYATARSTVSFLAWSDFSASGQTSSITLRYRVQQPVGDDVFAAVRFTLQAGSVVGSQVLQTGLQAAIVPPPQPVLALRPRPVQVLDRFSGPLFAAMHGPSMTLSLNSAFSLSQLDQAKAKAQAEKKPLGFLMVWGQFFDREADPRSNGSDSALVHFYQVFNQQLVLVFVRHETELGSVPRAVMRGFRGPDEGGYAPNMAVTDATATEFIVEIPFRDLDGAGRDALFAAGGRQIDQWLATHPDAVPTPAPQAPAPNP